MNLFFVKGELKACGAAFFTQSSSELFSHYRRRQVSGVTGRLVETVIVRLLPPLIGLPLWCLALSRLITGRPGLSGGSSSNLMKDSQLLLLSSARLYRRVNFWDYLQTLFQLKIVTEVKSVSVDRRFTFSQNKFFLCNMHLFCFCPIGLFFTAVQKWLIQMC